MRARLTAYAAIQLRDFLLGKGMVVALVVGVLAWGQLNVVAVSLGDEWATSVTGRSRALGIFDELVSAFALAGSIVAASGIISRDRKRGYFRLLFAKPVGVAGYYALAFLATGLGLVLLAAVGAQLFSLLVRPVSVPGAAAYVGVAWVLIGGLGFLLSALTSHDVLVLVPLLVASALTNAYATVLDAAGGGSMVLNAMRYALPPVQLLSPLRFALTRGTPVDPQPLAWTLAFGAIAFAAGLVVLRRRPLAA